MRSTIRYQKRRLDLCFAIANTGTSLCRSTLSMRRRSTQDNDQQMPFGQSLILPDKLSKKSRAMTSNLAFRIVSRAIAQQFNIACETITAETVALDVAGWDSFSNGLLIMAMEDAAGRPLPFDDLAAADNVGEMAVIIAKYL